MEDRDPIAGWKPLNIPVGNESFTGPVRGWRPLILPRDDRERKIIGNYGNSEKTETNELQLRFAKAIAEVVVERYRDAEEVRVMDVSANDLNVTLAFCKELIDELKLNGENPKKIRVWANDMSYRDDLGVETELSRRAEQLRQSSGEIGEMIQSPLIAKRAEDMVSEDFGKQKLDVIWDRLGAMWHTIGERDLGKVKLLLEKYRDLLAYGGLLLLDGFASGTGTGFDTDKKLRLLLADNNLDKDWFAQIGFNIEYETRGGQKILILKKL